MGERKAVPGRELIVMLHTGVMSGEAAATGRRRNGGSSLQTLAIEERLSFRPLFSPLDGRDMAQARLAGRDGNREAEWQDEFFKVASTGNVPLADEQLDELAVRLAALPQVASAYVKPRAFTAARPPKPRAVIGHSGHGSGHGGPSAPFPTRDFSPLQRYLDPAPGGLDARYAWNHTGGRGGGVQIIDIEGDWQLTHECLIAQQIELYYGLTDPAWRDHGTAVLGEIAANGNGIGVIGISHDSRVGTASIFSPDDGTSETARAINEAAGELSSGDILLIELHRPGSRYSFKEMQDQEGYIPVEWWPDDFVAIRKAVDRGIIVVSAAGNGGEDLDDPLYDKPLPSSDPSWKNPFRRSVEDSGSILVGAGAPPPGDAQEPDRSRLSFSNYGSSVDAQGWGDAVVSCGYGDLQDDPNEDRRYTAQFSGTSSAAPMIVGTLACLQGIRRAAEKAPLTPSQARFLLRTYGSPQQDAPGRPTTQRIGPRPDLKALIAAMATIP